MDLGQLINDNFSAEEQDSATSGECGTFALALYRALKEQGIASQLVLVVESDDDGNAVFLDSEPGQMSWRHCAVLVDEKFYDVDGLVEIDHLEANYPWGDEILTHILLEEADFVDQILCTQNDISKLYYEEWFPRFQDLFSQQLQMAA